jgi:formate hydrogenlyase subunit 4
MAQIILLLLQMVCIVVVAPLAFGIVKKCKAIFQGRLGASIFLPYQRILTLWNKEILVSHTASFVYHLVPTMVFSLTLLLAAYIPLLTNGAFALGLGSFIAMAGVFMLCSVFMVLGGLDTGGVFGGMAASREMTIASLVEPAVLLSFGAVLLHVEKGADIISSLGVDVFHSPSLLLAVVALVFVALAENARFPVDNPATHLELTMVHEGMILEYSGRQLALLELSGAIKLTIFSVLIANIVWPTTLLLLPLTFVGVLHVVLMLLVKVVLAMFFLALLESTIAKMRFYRMQEYLSTAALLGLSAVILTIL